MTTNEITENGKLIDQGYAVVYDHNGMLAYESNNGDICTDEYPENIQLFASIDEAKERAASIYGSKVWWVELWLFAPAGFIILKNEKVLA